MYDAIVLGMGGVGSLALRGLARQGGGGRFLGVERHTLLHTLGSSHGKTRVYRRAYFEHSNYVPWIAESIRVFREMEQEHHDSFVQECGSLIIQPSLHPNSSNLPQDLPSYCKASYESALQHDIPVEYLDAPTLQERYPQFNLRNDMVGMLEPTGGFVRCEKVTQAALTEAQKAPNVELMENTQALSLQYIPSPAGTGETKKTLIELTLQTTPHEKPIVVTTKFSMGAWTGQLFPSWAPYLRPLRQFQAWFPVHEQTDLYSYPQMPAWVMVPPDYPLPMYGVPCDKDDTENGCHQWLKIGLHGRPDYIANPSQNPREVSNAERHEVWQGAQHAIRVDQLCQDGQQQEEQLADIQPCFYTMTPDAHFLLGTPAGHEQVFCVAGLSGHGYKQAPALGQMMVDYALGKDMSHWNLDFCGPQRFGV